MLLLSWILFNRIDTLLLEGILSIGSLEIPNIFQESINRGVHLLPNLGVYYSKCFPLDYFGYQIITKYEKSCLTL